MIVGVNKENANKGPSLLHGTGVSHHVHKKAETLQAHVYAH